jgi:Phosphoribosylanthranilate isomerase
MTKIKICGITNLKDALLAIKYGAEAIGFVFSESPKRISKEQARKIIAELPSLTIKVGVFVDEDPQWVKELTEELNLDLLQFHGQENEDYLRQFSGKAFKAFRIKEASDLNKIASSRCRFFLLDSAVKGKPFDWQIAVKAKQFGKFFLAGGLNPDNVEAALKIVQPFGVDVSSGIELYPGKKDKKRMKEFIRRVKLWDYQQANMENLAEDLFPKL